MAESQLCVWLQKHQHLEYSYIYQVFFLSAVSCSDHNSDKIFACSPTYICVCMGMKFSSSDFFQAYYMSAVISKYGTGSCTAFCVPST